MQGSASKDLTQEGKDLIKANRSLQLSYKVVRDEWKMIRRQLRENEATIYRSINSSISNGNVYNLGQKQLKKLCRLKEENQHYKLRLMQLYRIMRSMLRDLKQMRRQLAYQELCRICNVNISKEVMELMQIITKK